MNIDQAAFESEVSTNDTHRREVALASMRGKLASCRIIIDTADTMAERALSAAQSGDYISAYRHCEAVFAATEEILAALRTVQVQSVKSSNRSNIAELPKFQEAVANGGLPPTA